MEVTEQTGLMVVPPLVVTEGPEGKAVDLRLLRRQEMGGILPEVGQPEAGRIACGVTTDMTVAPVLVVAFCLTRQSLPSITELWMLHLTQRVLVEPLRYSIAIRIHTQVPRSTKELDAHMFTHPV